MKTDITFLMDVIAFGLPAVCILWFGWKAIPVGVLTVWIFPLLTTQIAGPGPETVEADFYWGLIGWIVGLVYGLILLGIREGIRLCVSLWRRRKNS